MSNALKGFKAVEGVPMRNTKRSKWHPADTIDAFLETGNAMMSNDYGELEKAESAANSFRVHTYKNPDLPVRVSKRGTEVFLIRTDVEG